MSDVKKLPASEVARLDREIGEHIARAVSDSSKSRDAAKAIGDLATRRVELTSPPAFKRIDRILSTKKVSA
jgi:hypothetical protein